MRSNAASMTSCQGISWHLACANFWKRKAHHEKKVCAVLTSSSLKPGSYCRRHFHDCGWQSEMKRRASPVVGCGPQTATMRFHDRTADRQPHAAALRFRGEEGI